MGSKVRARGLARSLGVPVVPGSDGTVRTVAEAREVARELGYPLAVKPAGGGGGIGLRVAASEPALEGALEAARADGTRFFGDPDVYLERYFDDPRHVEIQVFGDAHGTVVELGERDCTIQRRHQKLVEETPSPVVDEALRRTLAERALTIARHVGYTSAGTVEGLLVDGEFFFLEMNTRLQVEHAVTELATGVDLVREQLRVAAGLPLSFAGTDVRGHALECRINAESAARLFVPSPGTIGRYVEPGGPGVRVDSGVEQGTVVPPFYDSLLAKLVVWDVDRRAATARMQRALEEFQIEGVETLVPFHRRLLATEQWARGETARDLLADRAWLGGTDEPDENEAVVGLGRRRNAGS